MLSRLIGNHYKIDMVLLTRNLNAPETSRHQCATEELTDKESYGDTQGVKQWKDLRQIEKILVCI